MTTNPIPLDQVDDLDVWLAELAAAAAATPPTGEQTRRLRPGAALTQYKVRGAFHAVTNPPTEETPR